MKTVKPKVHNLRSLKEKDRQAKKNFEKFQIEIGDRDKVKKDLMKR